LALAEEDNSIQGYSNGTFWERNTARLQMTEIKKNLTNSIKNKIDLFSKSI
jgi:hypothetical protein